MAQISWTESVPSITSAVGQFPPYARSVWTAISEGLGTSLMWDASQGFSAASGGEIRPGASRAFVAAQSASSAPNSQMTGRLFYASDTSRVFVYGSSGTFLAGTPTLTEFGVSAGTGVWVRSQGTVSGSTAPAQVHVSYGTTFALTPKVFLSVTDPQAFVCVDIQDASGFTSFSSSMAVTAFQIRWDVIGKVVTGF